MRPLEDLSGPWAGWWVQGEVKGQMSLTLHFSEGRIRGNGTDRDGGFQMSGLYNAGGVDLLKGYALLTVRYRGKWDGAVISGEWRIGSRERTLSGPFELWPVGDELSMELFMAEEELTLVGPSTPSLPARRSKSRRA